MSTPHQELIAKLRKRADFLENFYGPTHSLVHDTCKLLREAADTLEQEPQMPPARQPLEPKE